MDWRTGGTAFVLWLALLVSGIDHGNAEQRIVCYYTNWSVYRPGTAKFSPQNINPYLCTHLIYAFGGFTKDNTLKPFDKYQDIEKGGYAKFNGLKSYNKNLKTMLAIGGWNEGSSRFSPMVADPDRRRQLVKNAVKFLRQNHFDGLDLDWEYPAFRDGGKPRDKDNYADLVQELREEFERESSKTGRPRLLLTMAIPAGIEYLEKGYDLKKLNDNLDFFNLLSYDYHSAFEPVVNHHSPLYGLEEDNEYNFDGELTIDFTINYLLNHEVSSEKIVLGIPTYGRSYTLFNGEATDIGEPAEGPGEEGDATREKGYLAYYEICENIGKSDEWEVVQPNPKAMGPYAFKGNQWVGYDDESIVRVKALYVLEKKLGGIMFWSIDNDDFRGKCHGRPYPLIEAAKETLLTRNLKSSSNQKPKLNVNQKKPRIQNNVKEEEEESRNRKTTSSTSQRRTSDNNKIKPTRKRISSSRTNGKSNSRKQTQDDNVDEDNLDENKQEGNALREGSSKNRIKPRTRIQTGGRRKEQNSKRNKEISSSNSDSLSNELTTPEPPTTPDPGSDFKCEDEGFFSHPRDCKKYFWCLDSGPGGLGIVAHQFTCPSGLVFNKAADSCDYPRNVICPKTKTKSSTPTTPKAPITSATSRTTFLHSTTRRTTTTIEPELEDEEEYEYEEDANSAEESGEDIPVVSTTTKPHLYKTISRSKPTTTTEATTTEAQTTISSRSFKPTEKEFSFEDEEDPRVIKELIDLIKKAGGLEQLEKQLNYQEKNSGKETTEANGKMTPATISRSLYERVLNRQTPRIGAFFGSSTPRSSTTVNSRTNYQNGPGKSQFEGLDDVPEVKSLRRTKKPQYVTIERQRPSTHETSEAEEEEEMNEGEEIDQDNADVATSEDSAVSNLPESEKKSSDKRVTPSYVNIRRSRPTTPASENDLGDKDRASNESDSKFTLREHIDKIENEDKLSLSSNEKDDKADEPAVQKFRYTNTHRFRSTTSKSSDSTHEDIAPVKEMSMESITFASTEEPEFSETPIFSTVQSSTIPTSSTEELFSSTDSPTEKSTITLDQSPATEISVKLVDNSVTEILLTTLPARPSTTITPTPKAVTVTVGQPRPFGFPRRGRPTTASPSSPVPSSTEPSKAKVEPKSYELPTLKQLIGEITESSNASISTSSPPSYQIENGLNDVPYDRVTEKDEVPSPRATEHLLASKNNQGIKVPVRILDFDDSGIENNQFAFLSLPEGAFAHNMKKNIIRIQLIEQENRQDDSSQNKIENQRISKSRKISTDSNLRTRGSRIRTNIEERRATPRRPVSRRRGSSKFYSISKNTIDTSSTEIPITTVRPTTIRGSFADFSKIENTPRGFFITKSPDNIPIAVITTVATDFSTVDSNVNYFTTEIPSATKTNEEFYETTLKSVVNERSTDDSSLETITHPEVTNSETFEEIKNLPYTTRFPEANNIFDESTLVTLATPSSHDRIIDETLSPLMTKHFDETTIATIAQEINGKTIPPELQTEMFTSESFEKTLPTTTDSVFLQKNVQIDDKNTTNFESSTFSPETSSSDEMYNKIRNEITSMPIITLLKDTGIESSTIYDVQTNIKKAAKVLNTTEEISTLSPASEENPEITTSADFSSSLFMTENNLESSTTEENKLAPLIIEQTTKLMTTESHVLTSTSEASTTATTTTTTELSPKNTRPSPRRTRGKVRFHGSPQNPEIRERRPSKHSRRHPVIETSENPITEIPINENPVTESQINKTSEELISSEVRNPLSEISPHRRRNSSVRNRMRTSSTTMQSFNVTTEIPRKQFRKKVALRHEKTEPIDDQSIAESSFSEATQEVIGLRTSGAFVRRPGTFIKPSYTHIRSQTFVGANADRRFSGNTESQKPEIYDQSGRAQELTVSMVDPPPIISSFETGKEILPGKRGSQKHRIIEKILDTTEPPTIIRTTTPARLRQRPKSAEKVEKMAQILRPRHPAIIDYDYYVDEEVRFSIKPELKDKIYITPSGRIGCLDQGTFAHPTSCKKFITCAQMAGGKVNPTEYTCPHKLSFDPVGGICNWSAGLGCN